jgi:hypothetical protein
MPLIVILCSVTFSNYSTLVQQAYHDRSSGVQLKLSEMDGQLMLLTTKSGEEALFSYNRSLDYVAAAVHLANVLELEAVQADAATAEARIALFNKE